MMEAGNMSTDQRNDVYDQDPNLCALHAAVSHRYTYSDVKNIGIIKPDGRCHVPGTGSMTSALCTETH